MFFVRLTLQKVKSIISKVNFTFQSIGGELMDERNNHFDFDFTPIGQAIKKARLGYCPSFSMDWMCLGA